MFLYAGWAARSDTPYKVEHYQQDVAGDGYTLQETDELEGTTDATVTAVAKTYTGFSEDAAHAGRVASGTVAPDGSLVLKLYYVRDLHQVAYESNGGSAVATQEGIRYGATAVEPTPPVKQGYDFTGWYTDAALSSAYNFSAPVTEDLTLYARWSPRSDTPYKVEHYQQDVAGDGYTLKETDELVGTTDATVTAVAKTYTGFSEDAAHVGRVASGAVAPDGSLVLKLYYVRDLHQVAYESNGGSAVDTQEGIRYGATATEPVPPAKQGYDFTGWYTSAALETAYDFLAPVTADLTLYAGWSPRSDTPYKVEHYQQDVAGDGYTLQEADELVGTTDATVTAVAKTYTGFSEDAAHAGRVASGAVAPDGSLVLKLYYVRDLHQVAYESNGGSAVATQEGIRYGATATEPVPPTKLGYDFTGWYTDAILVNAYDFSSPVTKDITLYAGWSPRSDTPYKVEHYWQDVAGDGFTLEDTDELKGTTDATVTAVAKTYTGFSEDADHSGRVSSGTVAPDGSLVLKLYYMQDLHQVAYESNGGSAVATQGGIRYEATATEPASPTKQGYDFTGWYTDAALSSAYDFSSLVTADITLYASWSPRSDTPYKVEHYQQDVAGDGYTIQETDELEGTTDAIVTAVAKTYTGFSEDADHSDRVASGTVAPDGSLVLKMYYTRDLLSVTFDSAGGSNVAAQEGIRWGGLAIEPQAPSRAGYDFMGWWADEAHTITFDFSVPVTTDVTVYAAWDTRADTPYKVEHYQQDVAGDSYTLQETDGLEGTTDAIVTAAAKTYTGFHEITGHPGRIPSGNLEGDGSTVLALYYDRDLHSVTFDSAGGSSVEAQGGIRWGGLATEPQEPSRAGYDFMGWWADEAYTISFDFSTPITADVTAYASWGGRGDTPYEVGHYQQDVLGDGYTLIETDRLEGATDAIVTAVPKGYTGFHEATGHPGRIPSSNLEGDGSTVLALYYDRDLHSVTFDCAGGSSVAAQEGIRWGAVATEPEIPTRAGYDFGGWWADEAHTIIFDFSVPVTSDVTAYASWSGRGDVTYQAKHYQQAVNSNDYILADTDKLVGVTDTLVAAAPKDYTGFHENTSHPGRVPSGNLEGDGSTVLALYYDRDIHSIKFDANGGECDEPDRPLRYGHTIGGLPTASKDSHLFIGWYTQPSGGIRVEAGREMDWLEDTVLYAQWSNDEYGVVDGIVQDQDNNPVANAKITIRAGAVDYKQTTTDGQGRFAISEVKYGTYNLVVEKDGKVVTTLFEMDEARVTKTVVLPVGMTNSVVIVEENAPEIVVGGLDSLFGYEDVYTPADAAVVDQGGKVELMLTIGAREQADIPEADKLLSAASGKDVGVYLEMEATKAVEVAGGDTAVSKLPELPHLMEIIIPLDGQQGHSGYVVLREHNGEADTIMEEPNEAGEYIVVGDEYITLYACKFSIYALAYDAPSASGRTFKITAQAGEGGKISPEGTVEIRPGRDAAFEITPDEWHWIEDVAIDGTSVGGMTAYEFTNVYADHEITATFGCPSVPYADLDTSKWYHNDVDCVITQGHMIGVGHDKWSPMGIMTRAQMSVLLARISQADLADTPPALPFEDVNMASWYGPSVAWAYGAGVGIGYGKGRFGPGDALTREQLAVMLYRYDGSDDPMGGEGVLSAFSDGQDTSRWAKDAVIWAVNNGLLQGDGKGHLRPTGEITRAEVAAIIKRVVRMHSLYCQVES